jgi:hypothetical protein
VHARQLVLLHLQIVHRVDHLAHLLVVRGARPLQLAGQLVPPALQPLQLLLLVRRLVPGRLQRLLQQIQLTTRRLALRDQLTFLLPDRVQRLRQIGQLLVVLLLGGFGAAPALLQLFGQLLQLATAVSLRRLQILE